MGDRPLAHVPGNPADPCRTPDRRRGRGVAPCWADPQPAPPVRPGCRLWTDALPVGVSPSPDAGSSNRGMAATGDPAPPRRADPQAMRHRNGRTPAVRGPGLPRNALPSGTHGHSLTTWGGYVAIFISINLPRSRHKGQQRARYVKGWVLAMLASGSIGSGGMSDTPISPGECKKT